MTHLTFSLDSVLSILVASYEAELPAKYCAKLLVNEAVKLGCTQDDLAIELFEAMIQCRNGYNRDYATYAAKVCKIVS